MYTIIGHQSLVPLSFERSIALNSLIEEKNGITFQRLAYQCLLLKWPSLFATAEQADMGEDAKTIMLGDSDGIIRSLACSLTNDLNKLKDDAEKIKAKQLELHELIFATPKVVTEKVQQKWKKEVKKKFGWKLIVVEYSELVAILERPEAKWIRKQHLGIDEQSVDNLKPEEDAKALTSTASPKTSEFF